MGSLLERRLLPQREGVGPPPAVYSRAGPAPSGSSLRGQSSVKSPSQQRVFGNTKRARTHAYTHSHTHTHTHTSRTPLRYHSNALAGGPSGDTDRMTPTPSPDSLIYGDHPLLPGPSAAGSSDAIVQGRLTVVSNVWLGAHWGPVRTHYLLAAT